MVFYDEYVNIKIPFNKIIKIYYKEISYIHFHEAIYETKYFFIKISESPAHVYKIFLKNGKTYEIFASEKEKKQYLQDIKNYKKDGVLIGNASLEELKQREKYIQNNSNFPDYSLGKAIQKLEEKIKYL